MKEVQLALPWTPSVNAYKKPGRMAVTKTGKQIQYRVDTNVTKKFYYDVAMLCKPMMPFPFTGDDRLLVEVILVPPNAKFDIDNPIKCLLDSLTRAKVWPDDVQIDRLIVSKRLPDPKNARVIVKIEVINSVI